MSLIAYEVVVPTAGRAALAALLPALAAGRRDHHVVGGRHASAPATVAAASAPLRRTR